MKFRFFAAKKTSSSGACSAIKNAPEKLAFCTRKVQGPAPKWA
jgi:hypothetical protein